MAAWGRADADDYRRLPLRAHSLLADIPLHDAWRVTLPGGGPNRTIDDVRSLVARTLRGEGLNPGVRSLFAVRERIGHALNWDRPRADFDTDSFRHRLTHEDRRQSKVEPGTPDGPFQVLYVFDREAAGEVRNATVHAASVMALERIPNGYELFWAIYVQRVGRWTRLYMGAIDPFRRFLVYPSILRRIHRGWIAAHASAPDQPMRN